MSGLCMRHLSAIVGGPVHAYICMIAIWERKQIVKVKVKETIAEANIISYEYKYVSSVLATLSP